MVTTSSYDLNKDGLLTDSELSVSEHVLEIQLREQKADTHRKMAWTALVTSMVFTVFLLTPAVSVERIEALSEITAMFYVTQGGIVAAYMGVNAWMTKLK